MTATKQNFSVVAGDDMLPTYTIDDGNGMALDLSTASDIVWTCKVDGTTEITKKKSTGGIIFVNSGIDGKISIILTAADTARFDSDKPYQLYMLDGTGKKSTLVKKSFVNGTPALTP